MFMLTGCYDLEPLSYTEINPSIFPKKEKDLDALVMSCYYPLRGSWWDGINSTSEKGQMFINECCTEVLVGWYNEQQLCSEMSYNERNEGVTWFYYIRDGHGWYPTPGGYCNKISRCTLVLDEIANSSLNETQKARYMAEVRCARAFMSYILFDMYGPLSVAPLDILKNPLIENPLPRLSNEEMVKFIEEDLHYAAAHLPMPRAAEYGRFSAGLANMLLIRLYLHETVHDKNYYNAVDSIAREMMKPAWGYGMVNSYPSLFEAIGQTADNPEYIFVIPCSYKSYSVNQWQMEVLPQDNHTPIKGYGIVQSSWWFYDTFEQNDTRKTYLLDSYRTSSGQLVNRSDPGTTLNYGPIPLKYEIDAGVASHDGASDLDIVMYRYPDVLLSLAEAIVMKPGGSVTQEAIDLMNIIRKRAKLGDKLLTDFPTKEAFIDQLLTERSHEFWCESGQYRADLIRFDKLYDRVMELNNGVAPYASKDKYLFPLPLSVIVDGKGLVFQNPGYNN
jgi:hypothetical protein